MGNTRIKSRRRMRGSRGAALVEALVVIPFFIIIFASMLFAANLYGEKQKTMRLAKEYAWTHAMANCEGNGGPTTFNPGDSPMNQLASEDPQIDSRPLGQFNGSDPGMEVFHKGMGTTSATVTGSVTASRAIGGFTNQLSTTTTVHCNEAPQRGNLRGVFRYAWNLFKQW